MATAYFVAQEGLVDQVGVAHAALGGVEDPHLRLVVDQLEQVAVAGDDVDRAPPAGRCGQGADHVVGLVAVDAHAGDPERRERVPDQRHLRGEGVRALLHRVAAARSSRWVLYVGIASTRKAGRQSLSQQATR